MLLNLLRGSLMHKYTTEEEFGKDVKEILELLGLKVYSEVLNNDIVIKRGSKIAIIELKLNISDVFLEQLHNRIHRANIVIGILPFKGSNRYGIGNNHISEVKKFYIENKKIAILYMHPKEIIRKLKTLNIKNAKHIDNKKHYWHGWCEVLKLRVFRFFYYHCGHLMYEKGVLEINKDIPGYYQREILGSLRDYQLTANPGCVSGKMLSPAKNSCNLILEYLRKHPKCNNYKEIWKKLDNELHWASYQSMVASIRHWDTKGYNAIQKFMDRRKKNSKKVK